jgi:hypothetical protein
MLVYSPQYSVNYISQGRTLRACFSEMTYFSSQKEKFLIFDAKRKARRRAAKRLGREYLGGTRDKEAI